MLSRVTSRTAVAALSRANFQAMSAPVAEFTRTVHTERKLEELGLKLPSPAKPVASYVTCTRVGNLIYTGTYHWRLHHYSNKRDDVACWILMVHLPKPLYPSVRYLQLDTYHSLLKDR
jgi:hypothetical protein